MSTPGERTSAAPGVSTRWALCQQPRRVVAYCIGTECAVVLVTAALFVVDSQRSHDLLILAALAGMGILQAELGRQVERVRRRVAGVAHINMTSVWTFAGVLVLPPALTAVLVVILYAHLAARSWYRLQRVPLWRTISNATLVIITCYSAHLVFVSAFGGIADMRSAVDLGWRGAAAVAAAITVYFVVGAIVVIPARESIDSTMRGLFGGWSDNALEAATLCLGALNALALATMPGLALLVVPPLLLLHRTVLVKQLETAANTDGKTGLLNTAGWYHLAERELQRARQRDRTLAVLMIDLDFFKRVNDSYGHLAGDEVLKSAANSITSVVRDRDVVGRFGGEEFVVLLPDADDAAATVIAERVRESIARLDIVVQGGSESIRGLSASIGVAPYPRAGKGLQRLLDEADTALYQAKNSGRNKVVHVSELATATGESTFNG